MGINGFGDNPLAVHMSDAHMSNLQAGTTDGAPGAMTKGQAASESATASDGVQLSKLSSVLNGLENGASAIRRHVQQAMSAVRGGTYQVDPLQLSKRIIGEALGAA